MLAGPAAAETFDAAVKRGNLKICIIDGAPYALKTPAGKWIGHEIDIGERLASDFGLSPEYVQVTYADMIARLNKGDCDLISASLAIEPPRLREVWFTTPYGESNVRVVVASATPVKQEELDKAGIVLGVVEGTPAEDLTKSAFPQATVEGFPDLVAAERALAAGAVKGLVYKTPIPHLIAAKDPAKYVVADGESIARTADAFAVRKGDADMLNLLNGWVEARSRDGFLRRTHQYWLRTLDWSERMKPKVAAAQK